MVLIFIEGGFFGELELKRGWFWFLFFGGKGEEMDFDVIVM